MEEAGWQGHSNKEQEGLDTATLALKMEEGATSSHSLKPHWILLSSHLIFTVSLGCT